MRKLYPIVLGLALIFNLSFADNNITKMSNEIPGIGTVHQYQTGKNTYVGINLNLEILFIATATGSGFIHPGYSPHNEIAETIKSYYLQFQNNKYARKFDKLSQQYVNIPQRKFPVRLIAEVLTYRQVLASDRISKGDPGYSNLNIQKDLKHFYDRTNSKKFFALNLSKYNEMTAKFVTQHSFDYVSSLEAFFGVARSQDKFQILLSPLNNGGTAVQVENADGTMTYINIINPFFDANWVRNTIIHETAHHFIGPVLAKNNKLIKEYQTCLEQSFGNAEGFVKNDYESFLNEFLARVITISLAAQSQSPDVAYDLWITEKKRGWDNLDEVHALINNKYLPQREKYPLFEDFLPEILEYFKAKNVGRSFDIGTKLLERKELKEAKVYEAYWEGDSRISELKAKRPHSLMLKIKFSPISNLDSEQIGDFIGKAGVEFELSADGKPKVTVSVYEGNIYNTKGSTFWGFWAMVPEIEYEKLEPGVSYKLVPKKQNVEYRWIVDENVLIVLSNQ